MKTNRLLALVLAPVLAALFLTACEEYDESDHEPPDGQGAIVIKNHTYDDIEVFIDGIRAKDVNDDSNRAYNLAPGEYRIVLNEDDGPRDWSHRVDVLENRNTILNVSDEPFDHDGYSVTIDYDKP